MSSATPTVAARAIAVPARTASASTLRGTNRREHAGFGSFAKLVAIGFWGTLATLIVSAAAVRLLSHRRHR
jgi:hypothetical protein